MRPPINDKMDPEEFKEYYWLKAELHSFCRELKLSTGGSKRELGDRIYCFLKWGEVQTSRNKRVVPAVELPTLSLDGKIPRGYKNDQRHRAFFKEVIGPHFKFNVPFMNWMKHNSGKSYRDAVDQWFVILKEERGGKKRDIPPQFEYNRYTRDFFMANDNLTRCDAIVCWNFKKSQPGHNRYEDCDLRALKRRDSYEKV